jgi:hypothetical protein
VSVLLLWGQASLSVAARFQTVPAMNGASGAVVPCYQSMKGAQNTGIGSVAQANPSPTMVMNLWNL